MAPWLSETPPAEPDMEPVNVIDGGDVSALPLNAGEIVSVTISLLTVVFVTVYPLIVKSEVETLEEATVDENVTSIVVSEVALDDSIVTNF